MHTLIPIALNLLLGLICGGIIGIISYRLPLGIRLFKHPFCTTCKHSLALKDIVPIFSFFIRGGKCRYCRASISFRYFAIELTTATLFLLNYLVYPTDLQQLLIIDLVAIILLTILIINLESLTMPVNILLVLAALGMIYAYSIGENVLSLVVLPISNFVIVLLICFLFKLLFNKDALGGEDLKLIFVSGLFLSIENLSFFYLMIGMFSFLIGLYWKERRIGCIYSFGPAICISLYFCALFGKSLDLTLFKAF